MPMTLTPWVVSQSSSSSSGNFVVYGAIYNRNKKKIPYKFLQFWSLLGNRSFSKVFYYLDPVVQLPAASPEHRISGFLQQNSLQFSPQIREYHFVQSQVHALTPYLIPALNVLGKLILRKNIKLINILFKLFFTCRCFYVLYLVVKLFNFLQIAAGGETFNFVTKCNRDQLISFSHAQPQKLVSV